MLRIFLKYLFGWLRVCMGNLSPYYSFSLPSPWGRPRAGGVVSEFFSKITIFEPNFFCLIVFSSDCFIMKPRPRRRHKIQDQDQCGTYWPWSMLGITRSYNFYSFTIFYVKSSLTALKYFY